MNTTIDDRELPSCSGSECTSKSRREFLQSAGCFGIAVAMLGLGSADARALPVGFIEGTPNGGQHRYPIPATDGVNIDRGTSVIIARFNGHVYAFALSCPHENNAVKWVAKDHRFQCTKHDSQYQPDGVHTSGRATRNLDRYAVQRDGDFVVVDLHRWFQSDKDATSWAAAAIRV
jgi:nitrite reductase/ring-hydroxylating ferredoxin subunit